jgi:mono/diheme cytochrome c family protein
MSTSSPAARPTVASRPFAGRRSPGTVLSLLGVLAAAPPLWAQGEPARPPEVTDSTVARGRQVFHGAGGCSGCHGEAGAGTDRGPALAQGVWLHGPDTYEAILARVLHGVPKAYSIRGVPMPMRGWNTLSDEAVKAVAAYVWWISHPRRLP